MLEHSAYTLQMHPKTEKRIRDTFENKDVSSMLSLKGNEKPNIPPTFSLPKFDVIVFPSLEFVSG